MYIAMETLQWVLEEGDHVRELKNEEERKRYQGKIMYDGDGRELIPDNSPETFIEIIEGRD
jgi:hypothetical protein